MSRLFWLWDCMMCVMYVIRPIDCNEHTVWMINVLNDFQKLNCQAVFKHQTPFAVISLSTCQRIMESGKWIPLVSLYFVFEFLEFDAWNFSMLWILHAIRIKMTNYIFWLKTIEQWQTNCLMKRWNCLPTSMLTTWWRMKLREERERFMPTLNTNHILIIWPIIS